MKRVFVLLLASLLLLTGCAKRVPEQEPAVQEPSEQAPAAQTESTAAEAEPTEDMENTEEDMYKSAGDFGEVPEELKTVIEGDIFGARSGAKTAYSPSVEPPCDIVAMVSGCEGETRITLCDAFGRKLTEHAVPNEEYHTVSAAWPTSDGGFVYVLGFSERQLPDGSWASADGVCSTVVKCGSDGGVLWEREFEGLFEQAFERMIERDGALYFFGEYCDEPRESYDHIILLKLDDNGNVLARRTISGEDFDNLQRVDRNENGFTLQIWSQSRSGDFFPIEGETEEPHMHYGRHFIAEINNELELAEMRLGGEDFFGWDLLPVGYIDGREVYNMGTGFEVPGVQQLVLNCGEYRIIVSHHATGKYENQPLYISSIWCYTETVYSVFDKDGQLICRRCFDSTPDYEAIIESLEQD